MLYQDKSQLVKSPNYRKGELDVMIEMAKKQMVQRLGMKLLEEGKIKCEILDGNSSTFSDSWNEELHQLKKQKIQTLKELGMVEITLSINI